jgi:hypothetical protein
LVAADTARPCATNARSKAAFQQGIGPHSEAHTVKLVGAELERLAPDTYGNRLAYGVAYRRRCARSATSASARRPTGTGRWKSRCSGSLRQRQGQRQYLDASSVALPCAPKCLDGL